MNRIRLSLLCVALLFAVAGCASTHERGFAGAGSETGLGGVESGSSAQPATDFNAGQDYELMLSSPGWF